MTWPRPGLISNPDFFRDTRSRGERSRRRDRWGLSALQPGGDFDVPPVLFPEQTAGPQAFGQGPNRDYGLEDMMAGTPQATGSRRDEIAAIAAVYDPNWQLDPRFDRLVDLLEGATRDDPELWDLMQQSWTAAVSVAHAEFTARMAGTVDDPIAFGAGLVGEARRLLAEDDAAFLPMSQWLRLGKATHQFSVALNEPALEAAEAAAFEGWQAGNVAQAILSGETPMRLPFPRGLRNQAEALVGPGRMVLVWRDDEWTEENPAGHEQLVDIRLAPGTTVETPAEALTVLAEAALGVRHEILAGPDKLAGPQTWAGSVWELVGDVTKRGLFRLYDSALSAPVNWLAQTAINAWNHVTSLGDRPFELPGREAFRTSRTMTGERVAEAGAQAAVAEQGRLADPDTAVMMMASDLYAAGMAPSAGQAYAMASPMLAAMPPEDREGWEADRVEAAKLDAELEAMSEREEGLAGWFGDRFDTALELLNLENLIVETEGVRFLDTIGDLFQGIMGSLGLPLPGVESTIWSTGGDPVQVWRDAWDPMVQGLPIPGLDKDFEWTRPSEYFQIDNGGLAFAVDFAALSLDPWIWGTVGAGRAAKHTATLLATREGVEEALRLPMMRRLQHEVLQAARQYQGLAPVTGRAPLSRIVYLTNGMAPQHVQQLFTARTMEDVARVFRDATPAYGGSWLVDFSGRHMIRNTAQQIRWLSGLTAGTGKTAENVRLFLRRFAGGFSRDRQWSVSAFQGPADYVDQVAWLVDDPIRADQLIEDFYRRLAIREQELVGARSVAAARLQQANAGLRTVRAMRPEEQRRVLHRLFRARIRPQGAGYTVEELAEQTARAETRVAELEQEISLLGRRGLTPQELARETAARQAEIEAIRSGRWQEIDRLFQEIRQIETTTVVDAAKASPSKPLRTAAQYDTIRANMQTIRQLRNEPMLRGLTSADETMRRMVAENERWADQMRRAMHDVEEARTLAARARIPDRRRWMAERYSELWDEVAQDLKLDVLEGRKNPFTGGPLYDWSPVTGSGVWQGGVVDDVPRSWVAAGDDTALAEQVAEAGFFRDLSWWRSPATPMQVAAYRAIGSPHRFARIMGYSMKGQAPHGWNWLLKTLSLANRTFLTILLTPRIAFRSAMDEILRYVVATGHVLPGQRATGFLDESSAALAYSGQPGGLGGAFRQFGSTPRFGDRTMRAMREEYQSTFAHPTRGVDPDAWQLVWVKSGNVNGMPVFKSEKLHRNTVIRWVNGTWMGDDAARALSESIADTAAARGLTPWQVLERLDPSDWDLGAWAAYWEQTGRWYRAGLKISPDGPRLTGMVDGARAGRNMLRIMGGRGAHSTVDDLIRRTVDGVPMSLDDMAVIRQWGPMPSSQVGAMAARPRSLNPAAWQDYVTDLMYGNPGQNRWGLIHADYYDQALRLMSEANKHRVMSPQRLAQLAREGRIDLGYPGLTPEQAAKLYWDTNLDVIDDIAADYGLMTTHMMENVADRFARQQAHHIMYQPGATSILGRFLQRSAWPFGPAQYDYLSWWASEMSKASFVGLFGEYTQIPNFLNFRAMLRREPLGALPLNVRLLGRAADLGGLMAHHVKDPYWKPEDAIEALDPLNWIDEVTFLPRLETFSSFLLDVSPSVGPIPSVLIRMLPDPETEGGGWLAEAARSLRGFAETLQPGVSWAESVTGQTLGPALVDAFLPNYQGSFRDLAGLLYAPAGVNPFERAAFDAAWAEMRAAREGYPAMLRTGEDFLTWQQQVFTLAGQIAGREDLVDTLGRAMPGARQFYEPQDLDTPHWEGMVDELQFLLDYQLVGENTATNLRTLWAAYEDGSISAEGRRELHNGLRGLLQNLRDIPGDGFMSGERAQARLLLRHPELALALVGRYQAARDPKTGLYRAPAEHVAASGSPRYPEGATEDEIYDFLSRGIELGWFVPVSWADRTWRAEYVMSQAVRTVLADVYMWGTGRSSFDPGRDIRSRDEAVVRVEDWMRQDLALCGYDGELPDRMRGSDFAGIISDLRRAQTVDYPYGGSDEGLSLLTSLGPEGVEAAEHIRQALAWGDDNGYEHPSQYPDEYRTITRNLLTGLVEQQILDPQEYVTHFARHWGPIGWDGLRPDPPPLDRLDPDVRILRFDPDDVFAVDGDTVDVIFADGSTSRFRLVGVNAPDSPMPGAEEAAADLTDLLHHEGYTDLALVFWNLDRYGWRAGTDYATGKPRWKAWLYVNGQPIFNPDVFTPEEPLGIGPGVEWVQLPRPAASEVM